jgi:glycosyltransferase involved in cell wall biosynthesis
MKLVFITNISSYYQLALSNALAAAIGPENFRLVLMRDLDDSRKAMGWQNDSEHEYVIEYQNKPSAKLEAQNWINDSDVVVLGRAPIDLVQQRIQQGKLTFSYQERLWKKSFWRLRNLFRLGSFYKQYWSANRPNHHFLASGAYASQDIAKLGCFKNRKWKFGYFIPPSETNPSKQASDQPIRILWCGSLIKWKQPKRIIDIAESLHSNGVPFVIDIVGDGKERKKIENFVQTKEWHSSVTFHGYMKRQEIDLAMQKADIFLMTSNRKEGWGVVVNEAMSQGCCVVANQEAGSAPWLIKQGETGYLYSDQDANELPAAVLDLSRQRELCRQLGENAWRLHNSMWSSTVAAQRLILLSETLLNKQTADNLFDDGPCSKD